MNTGEHTKCSDRRQSWTEPPKCHIITDKQAYCRFLLTTQDPILTITTSPVKYVILAGDKSRWWASKCAAVEAAQGLVIVYHWRWGILVVEFNFSDRNHLGVINFLKIFKGRVIFKFQFTTFIKYVNCLYYIWGLQCVVLPIYVGGREGGIKMCIIKLGGVILLEGGLVIFQIPSPAVKQCMVPDQVAGDCLSFNRRPVSWT